MLCRIHKMICALLIALLLVSLTAGALAASKTVGYINSNTRVYKKATTNSISKSVSANTKVYITGTSGGYYKVQNARGTATGYVKKSCVSQEKSSGSNTKKSGGTGWRSKVVKKEWFKGGSSILRKDAYAYIYDIDTGIYLKIKRMGGHNHADVEPATAADTAKLLKIAGGKFSWKSKAVILKVGEKYVACGINTLPHGDQTIHNNNYEGQFCLHMCGSLCHGSGEVNSNHQYSINRAYNWAHR